jgi:acetyl-CoA acetyltransferase
MLSDPICLLDCDIPVTGAAAFVLTTRDRAIDLPHPPVYISGFAQGSPTARTGGAAWSLDAIMEGGAVLRDRLWHSCGFAPSEVDLPQLYDGFAPLVYLWLESLGFCGVGEAHEFVSVGGIASGTGLPVALSGGSLGNGRLHGLPQMIECYEQLSGRAGERQRPAEVALACHSMPHYGGVVVYTREPV